MQAFTDTRAAQTPDEIWLTEHPPVYTLGLAGRREHLLRDNGIPVLKVDRGGQVTYHGPGQLVAYLLIDIRRRRLGVRQLVRAIESAVIELLDSYGVAAIGRNDAPGVYVRHRGAMAKIAALGLKVRNGRSYHGLALNIDMDLAPYAD
ncbi:MAG: lipoyl(octanoyl) transferase LipB, partial [Casimicrobiaceae bacterium]